MRITLLTHYYAPETGAPQRRWSALVERFVAAGHEVQVLAPVAHYPGGQAPVGAVPAFREEVGRHGEQVLRLPYLPYRRTRTARLADQMVTAAAAMTKRTRADVLVATVPGMPTLAAGHVLARRTGAPLAVEMRDAWPDLALQSGVGGPVARVTASLVTRAQQSAAAVVTVSYAFAEVLRARGLPNVEVVSNGVDLSTVPALVPPPRTRERLEVLYLGTVGESQRLETAVRAAAAVGSRCRLTVIGDGVERDRIRALVAELGAPVRLLPPVCGEQLWRAYEEADTCLVCLRDWRAFAWTVPSKLYEVLALGRHVSGAVTGEAADIITASGAGDVVPPEDVEALASLWRSLAADRARLTVGGSGRAWVANEASYDALAGRYLHVLESLHQRAGV